MDIKSLITGERAVTKIAGIFRDEDDARSAVQRLKTRMKINPYQVKLMSPNEDYSPDSPSFSKRLEPESRGIAGTVVRTHLTTAAIGALAGLVLYLAMVVTSNAAVVSSPGISLFVALMVGTLGGLIAGGLFSLRPDHTLVIESVRQAMQSGNWAVVVHPTSRRQVQLASRTLQKHHADVVRSL